LTATEKASSVDYQRGYEAYVAGATLADNPHAPDVRAYLDWENGWSQARDDQNADKWRTATGAIAQGTSTLDRTKRS
jgi:ribosome modulation factor